MAQPGDPSWINDNNDASVFNEYNQFGKHEIEDNAIKWQLDPTPILEDIRHNLLGEVFTREGWVAVSRPLMTEDGINMFVSLLRTRLSQITSLSDLDKEDVLRMAKDARNETIFLLGSNAKAWNIQKSNMDSILNLTDHAYYLTLCRAQQGKERSSIRDRKAFITKDIRTNTPTGLIQDTIR